jgi:multidrug efflux pump subunit AcrA (membrane-fusion protein)
LVPDPSRSGIVQSASGGRIIATGGGLPKLGSNVKRGDVLFYVEPSASGGDLSGIAQERLQVLEELEVAKRRLMRLESLQGTIAGREIDEAKLRVDTLEKRASGLNSGESRREALRAPVSGRVGRMDVVAGQVVSPERVLVEIVAPDALIVEGAIHGSSQLAQKGAARLPDGRSLNLKLLGQGSALANQAVAVRFAVAETDATTDLPINTPVSVIAQLAEQQNGIVVPRDAIVQSTAGTPMVWVKVAPETFSPRDVRIEEHDGDSVLVVAGLKPPARVVVDGSALINQIR